MIKKSVYKGIPYQIEISNTHNRLLTQNPPQKSTQGGGREEEGGGELHEPKISVSVARFVQYNPQTTQIPKGSFRN